MAPDRFQFEKDDPRNERKFVSNSLSGNERNRLFMQSNQQFTDVTLLSGADDLADARSFSLLDFDNDGWLDIALMSLNTPRFKLYRNELGSFYPDNRVFRVQLKGGNHSRQPSLEWSNRDGVGARLLVTYQSGMKSMFQKQVGEGFGSQNSTTLRIGVPAGDAISKIDVRWPSGKTQSIASPEMSKILVVEEAIQ